MYVYLWKRNHSVTANSRQWLPYHWAQYRAMWLAGIMTVNIYLGDNTWKDVGSLQDGRMLLAKHHHGRRLEVKLMTTWLTVQARRCEKCNLVTNHMSLVYFGTKISGRWSCYTGGSGYSRFLTVALTW